MSTIVTATDAAQFLSLVPSMLGYLPARSLVVVPLARGRTLGALRVDLPHPEAEDAAASTVLGMICRIPEVEELIGVVYTDAEVDPDLPHRSLAEALNRCAEACGLRVREMFAVAGDGWGSYSADDLPPGGHSPEMLRLRSPLPGHPAVGKDQASGARLPRSSAAARGETERALASLRAALAAVCGMPAGPGAPTRVDPEALRAACELDDLPELYERALGWTATELSPMRTAALAWALGRPPVRDVALVQWATDLSGGDIAMEAQRRWEDGAEYPVELAAIMWGEAPRPEVERLEAALELVRQVAARTPKPHRAGALGMAAWLSWALGRSTHAARYARMALQIDPDHGLSEIVASFVNAGHLPEWAFHRP